MNTESIFRGLWDVDKTLRGLLPVSRICTGVSMQGMFPYAVILETENTPKFPGNAGEVRQVGMLKITFHARGRAELDMLAEAMDIAFSGTVHTVSLGAEETYVRLRRTRRAFSCVRHDQWMMEVEMEITRDQVKE